MTTISKETVDQLRDMIATIQPIRASVEELMQSPMYNPKDISDDYVAQLVGMISMRGDPEWYETIRPQMNAETDNGKRVLMVLEGAENHAKKILQLSEATLNILGQFGVETVQFV